MIPTYFLFDKYDATYVDVLDQEISIDLPFRIMVGDRVDPLLDELDEEKMSEVYKQYGEILGTSNRSMVIYVKQVWADYKDAKPVIVVVCGV